MRYLVVLVMSLVIAGCGLPVRAIDWSQAEKFCADNSGVKKVGNPAGKDYIEVWCNNGAYFHLEYLTEVKR